VFLPAHQQDRSWCDTCLPDARRERNLAPVGTARKRRRPERPATSYATKGDLVRAERMAAPRVEERELERRHQGMRRPLPEQFAPLRAGLAGFRLDTIAVTIRVSRTAAGYIRSRKQVPHIRHWSALAALAGVPDPLSEHTELTNNHLPALSDFSVTPVASGAGDAASGMFSTLKVAHDRRLVRSVGETILRPSPSASGTRDRRSL
jgi:hypothetical protein